MERLLAGQMEAGEKPVEYLSPAQAARRVGVSRGAVRQWIERHGLPATEGRRKGHWRVSTAELVRFIQEHYMKQRRHKALVLVREPLRSKLKALLNTLGFDTDLRFDPQEALTRRTFPSVHLVVVENAGDGGGLAMASPEGNKEPPFQYVLIVANETVTRQPIAAAIKRAICGFVIAQPLDMTLWRRQIWGMLQSAPPSAAK
jgi:excisionase family DNA binding protein